MRGAAPHGVESGVVSNPVEPGAQSEDLLSAGECAVSLHERLLHRVLRPLVRGEACAVAHERLAVTDHDGLEGGLGSGASEID